MFKQALLLEDEPSLAEALGLALGRMSIRAQTFNTLTAAEAWLEKKPFSEWPDLYILDRSVPDGDGLSLCRYVRDRAGGGAILILTANNLVSARVEGLKAGADDYLPKPFSWEELMARIEALGRRISPQLKSSALASTLSNQSSLLWQIDQNKLTVLGPLGAVTLTPLEFKLVTRLIETPEQIVSRDELLREVWGFKWLPKTRTVDYFMSRLRKAFEPNPEDPRHFLTVRGLGYRFVP